MWQLGALARADESVVEGPARNRHRRHRRLPRPRRRQRQTPGHCRHPGREEAFDKRLPNTEPKLRELFAKLQAKHGTVLVVVDQPASIDALPLTVARGMGCPVAYLPGLTMRRIADLYPGEAKTDAKDAFIIADAARAMPHTLRAIDGEDETIAELEMIAGFDDDLAGEATRVANRLHGLLAQIHPSLERVLGPRLQRILGPIDGQVQRGRSTPAPWRRRRPGTPPADSRRSPRRCRCTAVARRSTGCLS